MALRRVIVARKDALTGGANIFCRRKLGPIMALAVVGLVQVVLVLPASAATDPNAAPEPVPPSTPREFFNAGTEKLRQGKLREAEAFFQTALAAQNEQLQPPTLYYLGHVRFGQGLDELKKGPSARPVRARSEVAGYSADKAIEQADEALAGEDVQKMVAAYLRGRGTRKELRDATKAVRQAMDTYGAALGKWQRASGDFKSAVELDRHDADAQQNADTVDRCIAKLVDTLQQLSQLAAALGQKKQDLGDKMKKLKGKIPDDEMPPGAAGDDEEDEEQPGPKPGDKESAGKAGEQQWTLSPEEAAWLLEGFRLDNERRLSMGQKDTAPPKNRSRKTW
jgi:tetratricopeptide (TPR) repeat protein